MGDAAPAGDGDALGPAASLVEESRQSDGQRLLKELTRNSYEIVKAKYKKHG